MLALVACLLQVLSQIHGKVQVHLRCHDVVVFQVRWHLLLNDDLEVLVSSELSCSLDLPDDAWAFPDGSQFRLVHLVLSETAPSLLSEQVAVVHVHVLLDVLLLLLHFLLVQLERLSGQRRRRRRQLHDRLQVHEVQAGLGGLPVDNLDRRRSLGRQLFVLRLQLLAKGASHFLAHGGLELERETLGEEIEGSMHYLVLEGV